MMMPESEEERVLALDLFLSSNRLSLLFVGLSGEKVLFFKWMVTVGDGGDPLSPKKLEVTSRSYIVIARKNFLKIL